MNERTAEHPQDDQTLGKAPESYASYTDVEIAEALAWLDERDGVLA